jgi:peptidoglycan/LPS O-acetylase OafA/YrhL
VSRDRGIDALRGLAMAGVVLGHWLVTAPGAPDAVSGRVTTSSPLAVLPDLAPVSWLLQTLALFFLLAGWAAARRSEHSWRRTLSRAVVPVGLLAVAVTVLAVALSASGAPQGVVRTVVTLSLRPLWFLGVYLVLSLATPLMVRFGARLGLAAAGLPLALALTGLLLPSGTATTVWTALTAWWVPWQCGITMSRRPLSRGTCIALLAGGGLAVMLLVTVAGLPDSAVGVPGDRVSNLDPPSAATLALGLAQVGAAGLLLPLLHRVSGPVTDVAVRAGRATLPVFLLHQPLFVLLWLTTLPSGPLPGLHDTPTDSGWLLARAGWLVLLALLLLATLRGLALK